MLSSVKRVLGPSLGRRFGNSLARSMSLSSGTKPQGFYSVAPEDNTPKVNSFVRGEVVDYAVDLKTVRPGDTIDVPYEVTISHSFRDFWQSAFYSYDRINTSTPFARSLGLQDQVVPFNLMLFLAGSMSHADHAKLQMGYTDAIYHWPAFAGDTFKKRFVIRSLRSTSDQLHSVFSIHCMLLNQRDVVVFSCNTTMMFPFVVPPSQIDVPKEAVTHHNSLLSHIVRQVEVLEANGSQTLRSVRPGQLILHTLTRPLSETHMMQLATLARLTHERHFNTRLFRKEELFVPGGLVLGLVSSLTSRDLHEALYEDLLECTFPNNLTPGDTVGAVSFVQELEEHVSGDIECITVRTIGIKNCDVHRQLKDKDLPVELFTRKFQELRPAELEELVRKNIPELSRRIVCIADRKIYRQAPKHAPFLL